MHEVRDRCFLAKGRFWNFMELVLGRYGLRANALKPTIMHSYGISKSGPSALVERRLAGQTTKDTTQSCQQSTGGDR